MVNSFGQGFPCLFVMTNTGRGAKPEKEQSRRGGNSGIRIQESGMGGSEVARSRLLEKSRRSGNSGFRNQDSGIRGSEIARSCLLEKSRKGGDRGFNRFSGMVEPAHWKKGIFAYSHILI